MSIAVKHADHAKLLLTALSILQVSKLVLMGQAIVAILVYYLGTRSGAALTLGIMTAKVDLNSPENCIWWLKNGNWITGCGIASGLLYEYSLMVSCAVHQGVTGNSLPACVSCILLGNGLSTSLAVRKPSAFIFVVDSLEELVLASLLHFSGLIVLSNTLQSSFSILSTKLQVCCTKNVSLPHA